MSATAFQRLRREQSNKKPIEVVGQQKDEKKPAEPTVKELMALLDGLGIAYEKKANKATLMELFAKAQEKPEDEDEDLEDDPDNDEGAE